MERKTYERLTIDGNRQHCILAPALYGHEYVIVSYSPLVDETAVFPSNEYGDVVSWVELDAIRGKHFDILDDSGYVPDREAECWAKYG